MRSAVRIERAEPRISASAVPVATEVAFRGQSFEFESRIGEAHKSLNHRNAGDHQRLFGGDIAPLRERLEDMAAWRRDVARTNVLAECSEQVSS